LLLCPPWAKQSICCGGPA